MFISWKTFTSNAVGKLCVGVKCDKCGGAYYYELSRIGSGAGTAIYGIGQGGARSDAEKNAVRALQERLASEAELVACPKCHWINEELITGFRQGRYRGLSTTGAIVAIIGVAISLICAGILYAGPAAERGAISYFLIGGPIASISFLLVTLFLQRWLRSRIQPNRDYPLPPAVPPGTPLALLRDEESGALIPAIKESGWQPDDDAPVEIQLGRHEFPEVCCRCLKSPDPNHAVKTKFSLAVNLVFPLCEACAKAISRRRRIICAAVTLVGLLLMALGLWAAKLQKEEFWIFFVLSLVLAPTLGGIAAHMWERPVKGRVIDSARGIVRIHFRNRGYQKLIRLGEPKFLER